MKKNVFIKQLCKMYYNEYLKLCNVDKSEIFAAEKDTF